MTVHTTSAFNTMTYYFKPESLIGLTNEIHRLDEVMIAMFAMDDKGNVRGSTPQAAMATARMNNETKVFLTISNYGANGFNTQRVKTFLRTNRYKNRLIKQLMTIIRKQQYDGVNVDFERIPKSERGRMTNFIKQLANRLHKAGKLLVISVPPTQVNSPNDLWKGAFNYKVLGQVVDIMQVMTYDQHGPWDTTDPGPVAGLDWVKRCVDFMITIIPAAKISVGIPAYGYVYNLDAKSGYTVRWNEFPSLIEGKTIQWDIKSSTPFVEWTSESDERMVAWLENEQSIRLKAHYVRNLTDIHGVSIWALAYEDSAFWNALFAAAVE